MNANDVEDLLAGLSDDELPELEPNDKNSRDSEHDDLGSLEARIGAEATAVSALYRNRIPRIDELMLTPDELTNLVNIIGNIEKLENDTHEQQLELTLGRERTVKLCIDFSKRKIPLLSEAQYDSLVSHNKTLAELLRDQKAHIEKLTNEANQTSPNLAHLVDPRTVALLIMRIGSIAQLATTPPANLVNPRTSPLIHDPLITQVPESYKRQALRILAGKLVLAARLDMQPVPQRLNESITAMWKRNIVQRINKLLAPPPSLQHRALPKPVDKRNTRRGGSRIRKLKQKRQAQLRNETIKFGDI